MIPANQFLLDGDFAWVVIDCPPNSAPAQWEQDDKPCDQCDGTEHGHPFDGGYGHNCTACIDGRHTFDIEVPWTCRDCGGAYCGVRSKTYRVSIVPGIVLPIVLLDYDTGEGNYIALSPSERIIQGDNITPVSLPPAAAPGMWAVQLKVAL